MKRITLFFSLFAFVSPVFSFTAGESIPCSENINALQPGYCDGGSHTITQDELESHNRNEEQYQQSSAMWGRLRSAGCVLEMDNLALCELRDGVLYPYPGVKKSWNKLKYTMTAGGWAGQTFSLAGLASDGSGPFSRDISRCGKNPIFAHLNNPLSSCDRTAQDIVEWVKWRDETPRPAGCATENGKYYGWENGAKKEISKEACTALRMKVLVWHDFKTWEEMYNSEKEAKAGTASLKPADSGTRSGNVSNSAGPADPPASGASFGDANYNGVPVDRNIGSASYVVKDAGGGEAYSRSASTSTIKNSSSGQPNALKRLPVADPDKGKFKKDRPDFKK